MLYRVGAVTAGRPLVEFLRTFAPAGDPAAVGGTDDRRLREVLLGAVLGDAGVLGELDHPAAAGGGVPGDDFDPVPERVGQKHLPT